MWGAYLFFFFFFQAEDGIRDVAVTGVQTCALPILLMGELKNRGNNHAFIGLGTVGDAHPRRRLYETVSEFGFQIVPAIHTAAVISSSARIGVGPTIMAGAVVNASALIGDNVIVNTGAIVEHDCLIGDHAHIATG